MPQKCELGRQTFVDLSIDTLRSADIRVTKARLEILQALADTRKPQSTRELFESVSEDRENGKINQVTVYRTLEIFEALGLVHRVFPSGSYLPCFHRHCGDLLHILIRCSSCEEISELDVPQETLAPMLWYLKREHGFSPDSHFFQVNGVCSTCEEDLVNS